jgi:hypothetical protein
MSQVREQTAARMRNLARAANEMAEGLQQALSDRYAERPEQFSAPPRVLRTGPEADDFQKWSAFDDAAPWNGEWDNTGGG